MKNPLKLTCGARSPWGTKCVNAANNHGEGKHKDRRGRMW